MFPQLLPPPVFEPVFGRLLVLFLIEFLRIWEPTWPPKSIQNPFQIGKKTDTKIWWLFDMIFDWFFNNLGSILASRWKLGEAKSVILITLLALFAVLGHLLLDGLLAAILTPTWPQVGAQKPTQIDKKSIQKSMQKVIKFWIDFWSILGSTWRPSWEGLGVYVRPCWELFCFLGAKMVPSPPT